ncbi:MAG: pyruvate kinase [Bacillota bacterium]|nr:pyruvate kinase [Bacillota bacterium]
MALTVHRRTKIVGTLGPSTDGPGVLESLLEAGLDLVRLNFSHGTYDDHLRRLAAVRRWEEQAGRPVGVVVDIQGPKIRTGVMREEPVTLVTGEVVLLTADPVSGTAERIPVVYPPLARQLRPGMKVYLDDAQIELRVVAVDGPEVHCEVVNGGLLFSRKGVSLPEVRVDLPAITEKDAADIAWAVANGADFVAVSFVRQPEHVIEVRRRVAEAGGRLGIIAKVENPEALVNVDQIIEAADAVMVARGDLGVSIPPEDVPVAQKDIIRKCNAAGKPVITATQMLNSMIGNPRPTRAEVTDVANAILDGTDAVMLSGETASGKYPVEAVKMMTRVIIRTEEVLPYADLLQQRRASGASISDAISHATCQTAQDLKVAAIITSTQSGATARLVAKYRPEAPIVAATPDPLVARQLTLVWGVRPVGVSETPDIDAMLAEVVRAARELGYAGAGDVLAITAGLRPGVPGSTNLLKVHVVE